MARPLLTDWSCLWTAAPFQLPSLYRLTFNWLAPRLVAVSHQNPGLLFTTRLWTEHSCNWLVKSQSQNYITTNGQSASLSRNKAPIWGLRPDIYYCQTVVALLMWGGLFDERTDLRLQLLLALANAVILRSESHGTRDHILLSQIQDFPFRRLPRHIGLRWRYSTLPSKWLVASKRSVISVCTM
jgi:hypothetical protein